MEISETKLGANQLLNEEATNVVEDLAVVLQPMEIRTFLIKTDKNNSGDDGKGSGHIFVVSPVVALLTLTLVFIFN